MLSQGVFQSLSTRSISYTFSRNRAVSRVYISKQHSWVTFQYEYLGQVRKFSSNALLPCTDVRLSWSPAAQWSKEFFSHCLQGVFQSWVHLRKKPSGFEGPKYISKQHSLGNFPNEKAWDRRENSPATPYYRVLM